MGNQLATDITHYDEPKANSSKLTKFIKSKLRKSSTSKLNVYEKFIVRHKHSSNNIPNMDINALDQRRIVFISLTGLFQTWNNCPCHLLYSALLLMPLKRKWVYYPSKYINELKSHFVANLSLFSDSSETKQFIELLKWKDEQGFVFWMLDDCESKETLISPFWYHFNDKLIKLYDPVSNGKYKSLNLNPLYWKNEKFVNKYETNKDLILKELYFLKMRFKCIQQIIFDSNPESLNPIKWYGDNGLLEQNEQILTLCDDNDNDNWWISADYDPYDLMR